MPQETKHLTPLEWLKENGYDAETISWSDIQDILTKYHDYALDRAAEVAEVEMNKETEDGDVTETETSEIFTTYHSFGQDVFSVSKQSILNLKINGNGK